MRSTYRVCSILYSMRLGTIQFSVLCHSLQFDILVCKVVYVTIFSQRLSFTAPQPTILLLKCHPIGVSSLRDRRRSGSLCRTSWAALDSIHHSKARGRSGWICSPYLATFRAWRWPRKKVKKKNSVRFSLAPVKI